jgi:hypothetical protein
VVSQLYGVPLDQAEEVLGLPARPLLRVTADLGPPPPAALERLRRLHDDDEDG